MLLIEAVIVPLAPTAIVRGVVAVRLTVGAVTVYRKLADRPRLGSRFWTATVYTPATDISASVVVICRWLASVTDVVFGTPFHRPLAPFSKVEPVPVMKMVTGPVPATLVFGPMALITGCGL